MLEDWDVGSELGQGLCGGVKIATRKRDQHQVALKLIDMEQLKETFKAFSVTEAQLKENVRKEIDILKMMRHKNIVRLEDTWAVGSQTFLCLELVPGEDLLSLIPDKGLSEPTAKNLFFQISAAVVYCHAHNVIHGDLKPENILVRSKDNRVKLIDFGFAHIVEEGVPLKVIGGTLQYCPPWDPKITYAWDDWAMGVILFAMLSATLPFSVEQLKTNSLEIIIPSRISDDALHLLKGYLNPDMEERSSTSELMLNSDWLKSEREKSTPETLSHCMSRPLEPGSPSVPNGHTSHLMREGSSSSSSSSSRPPMVPSMSVMRLTSQMEESEEQFQHTAAPLVRTRENFFSFFKGKKRDRKGGKTPPKKTMDPDLPVAPAKSEENVRTGKASKFPWSPAHGVKKSPPLAMASSGLRFPEAQGSQGRARTASCADQLPQSSKSFSRSPLYSTNRSPSMGSSGPSTPPPLNGPNAPFALGTIYPKDKKRKESKKKSLLSLSPSTPPGTPGNSKPMKKRKSVTEAAYGKKSPDKDVEASKSCSSLDGAGWNLTMLGFLTTEYENSVENHIEDLQKLCRLQTVLKKSLIKELKPFFLIVNDLLEHQTLIFKSLKTAKDLHGLAVEIVDQLSSKKIKKLKSNYCREVSTAFSIIFDASNHWETGDRVLLLDMLKKPLANATEEIAYVKGLATSGAALNGRDLGDVLEILCVFHCHCTMMLCL